MKHLLSIDDLTEKEIRHIVDIALSADEPLVSRKGESIALLFLEPSTRTRVSFERAAHLLEAQAINLSAAGSSLEKDESLKDTILTLRSMGIRIFVIRCKQEGVLKELAKISGVHIVNAGEGKEEHPTQALLDLATLKSVLGTWDVLKTKKMAIIGDLASSRVAKSWSKLAAKIGLSVRWISPLSWKADWCKAGDYFEDLEKGLAGTDIVMALRVQRERHEGGAVGETGDFIKKYQLRASHLEANRLLLHPGPVNWGVELHTELQTHAQSLILLQVKHGVDIRRVVLSELSHASTSN